MIEIHVAAYFGLKKILINLLEIGYNPNLKNNYNRTSFLWAAEEKYENIIKLLLAKNNIDLDINNTDDRTPLSLIVENGYERMIRLLLATENVNPNFKNFIFD
jgi:ankyrin repeat protein